MAEPQFGIPLNSLMGLGANPAGMQIIYGNAPGQVLGQLAINAYSVLSIPDYWRGITFLSENMASFTRKVKLDDEDPAIPHYLDDILNRNVNLVQNATVFWRTLYQHRFTAGNGYARVRRGQVSPKVISLETLFPYDVVPFRAVPEGEPVQQFYYINSTKEILGYEEVIHLMGVSYDGMRGIDPTWLHHDAFERARTVLQYETRYLKNGTVLRYTIEIPGPLDEKNKDQFVHLVNTKFAGPSGDQDIMILTDGAKLSNQTATALDAQLKEQGAASTIDIAQILGVPPQILYHFAESKYNNPLQVDQDILRNTFRPNIEQVEDELTRKLLSPAEQKQGFTICLDPSALNRGDTVATSAEMVAEKAAGIRSANEARVELGLPERKGDPTADDLKTSGDTAPQGADSPPAAPDAPKAAPDPSKASQEAYQTQNAGRIDLLAAFRPLIADATRRIEARTDKQFAAKAETLKPELTKWAANYSEDQARYVCEAFAPVKEAMQLAGIEGPDLDKIAVRYSESIRKRAVDGSIKSLSDIILEVESESGE